MKFDIVGNDKQTSALLIKVATLLDKVVDKIEKLDRAEANPRVELDGEAETIAGLDNVDRKRRDLDGKKATVKVDVDKSLTDTINSVARLGGSLQTLAKPISFAAAIPQVAALGSAALTTSGSLLLLPAAGVAAGAAAGVAAIGFSNLSDALGDNEKKARKAYAALSTEGKQLVDQVKQLGPAWASFRHEVQDAFLDKTAESVKVLSDRYLPVLRGNLVGIAQDFNVAGRASLAFLSAPAVAKDWDRTLSNTRVGVSGLTAAMPGLARGLTDVSAVGSGVFAELTQGAGGASEEFANFIAQARESGKLEQWMRAGISSVEQLGRIAGNTGTVLYTVFRTADEAGASFLDNIEKITGGVKAFVTSADGNAVIVTFFREIRDTVDELAPGAEAAAKAVGGVIQQLGHADVLSDAAGALSSVAEAAGPVVQVVGFVASGVLPPLLATASAIAPVLVPVAGGLLAIAAAGKGVGAIRGVLDNVATGISNVALNAGVYTEKVTGSAAAGEKVAASGARAGSALQKLGGSIPLLGLAVTGLGLALEAGTADLEGWSDEVLRGQLTLQGLQQKMDESNSSFWNSILGVVAGKTSMSDFNLEVSKTIDKMGPLQQAQAYATLAQERYNEAVRLHGPASREAKDAQAAYAFATDGLTFAQGAAKFAVEGSTQAIIDQTNAAFGAANADIGLQQATLRTAEAHDRATQVLRTHSASSVEGKQAILDLTQATYDEAAAAGRKAQADAEAKGASDAAAQGAKAQTDKLIELAAAANGPTRQALLVTIAGLQSTKDGSNNAAIAAAGLTGEIARIPGSHATNVTTPGLAEARAGISALSTEIRNINGKDVSIFVTATGKGGIASAGRLATGGILPGYTPGRDVHTFVGPAGALELSGGEAVMRPEWTRAVGPGYVHAANAAARSGGVPGVADFVARTAPRRGGFEGRYGDGSKFADGGVVGPPITLNTGYRYQGDSVASIFGSVAQAWANEQGGNGLAWARTQVGKPYIWGGVGPAGYDCSGFMSAIVNVMRGRNPYSRVGSTGTFPWGGFLPGIGPGLSIGAFRGNPGHMAGTIAGVNVESAGSVGVRVGGPVGAGSGMFNIRAHLPMANGGLVDRPTFGLIGEAGPELVLPLNRPSRAQQLARRAGVGGAAGGITVQITGPIHIHKEADVDAVVDRLNYLVGAG